jgi:hypothetical protein
VPLLSECAFEGAALVSCDVVGLVALDFILGILLRSVMDISFVIEVSRVDRNNGPRHPSLVQGTATAKAPLAMSKNASTGRFYSRINVLIL